jgi:hypothetical protein
MTLMLHNGGQKIKTGNINMSETGKQAQVVARRMHITPLALLAAVVSFSVFLLIARPYVASAATAPDSIVL